MTREELFHSLKNSELLRNTSILVSGTAVAQLIPILLQPILRRYYSPDIFGAYAVYLSLIGILGIISSFKYELAIILPRKDKEAANVFFLTILINILFDVLLVFVIIIWKTDILHFFNLSDKFSDYLYFVPLGIFFYSFYQSINYWLIRKKGFFPISINKFVRRGFEGFAQVAFKFAKNSHGIIFGDLIGHFANIISGIYQGKKRGLSLGLFSLGKIKFVALKYFEFPKYNVIPSFMSACSFLLPVILLNKFFSSEITGFFDLSKLLLSIPLALISTSISNVLLQSISEKFKINKSLKKDLLLILGIVCVIGTVEIIVITFFGVELFKLIFGELWGFSGKISQILVWSYALNFFVASFSAIFISMNKIKLLSAWQLFYFISIISLTFFRKYEFLDFLRIYVSIEVFCYLISIVLMFYIVSGYERRVKAQV
ncbi:MAG: oligosaccharide flippase family protein [Bacteroidota bacterium]